MRHVGFRAAVGLAGLAGTVVGLLISSRLNWTTPAFTRDAAPVLGSIGMVPADFVSVARRVTPSVVSITTSKTVRPGGPNPHDFFSDDFFNFAPPRQRAQRTQSLGSGVIVGADGIVVTNNHVIEGADAIEVVLSDRRSFKAKVIGTDPKTDMAVIRLTGAKDLPTVPWADAKTIQVGEWVLAIGNPMGLNSTVTAGIISAEGRADVGVAEFEDFLQTDAAINPGNSGGALVNLRGELVGINTAIASRSGGSVGIGFAIPSRMARPVMEALVDKHKVTRGYLGVGLEPMTAELARSFNWAEPNHGILIAQVQKDTPAAAAGLKDGDILIGLNGEAVDDVNRFRNTIALTPPGQSVRLDVVREGKKLAMTVKLAELPGPRERPAPVPEAVPSQEMGFEVQSLTPELADRLQLEGTTHGAVVTDVEEGSAAADAGLAQGDVIVAFNRQPVRDAQDVTRLTSRLKTGDSVLLRAQRGGASRYLAFRLE